MKMNLKTAISGAASAVSNVKRIAFVLVPAAVSLVWVMAQVVPANRPMASFFPPGPALYVEAKNLAGLMREWNGSQEKNLWVASDNYQVFSRSNLFLKLRAAQAEFAAAAGVPPDMALLNNVAGAEAGIAIYDIGELQFLYVTKMPSARVLESSLWKARGTYQPRKSSGLDYYVRSEKGGKRVAAFASAQDYLLLATREDLVAGALALLATQKGAAIATDPWYTQAIQAVKEAGELRLVLNMPSLMQSPYMRSYWVQRNASELKQYGSAISDATRAAGEIRENRSLFRLTGSRLNEEPPAWNENAVAQITRLVPANAGLYQAWASPTPEQAFALVRAKLLQPQSGGGPASRIAPGVGSPDSIVGSESDLETRIDEAPFVGGGGPLPDAVRDLLATGKLEAMLSVGVSRVLPDGVFAGLGSAVVLLRSSNWDAGMALGALASAGMTFDGPSPMALLTSGPLLILSDRPDLAQSILAGAGKPAAQAAGRYSAAYQHGRELPNFIKLTRLIDNPLRMPDQPMFFSQNAGSLGQSMLGRLDSASMVVHDTGTVVTQKLVYKLKL